MKSAAKLWLAIFSIGFTVLVVLLVITLLTPPAFGGLTRIGRVSERAFGWHTVPPPIAADHVRSVPLEQADVLVVGDSFSMYFAWQASLVEAGYRVTSTHWDKISPLCKDFGTWIRASGFKGRLVVLESIERLMPERLKDAQGCLAMRKPFSDYPAPGVSPSTPAPRATLNWESPLLTGLITYQNTRAIARSTGVLQIEHERFGDFIFSSPVANGCALFSNQLCDKSLFLAADRENPELTAADADFMQAFTQGARPVQVMWMVIPNKTSVYLDTEHAQAFVSRANALALGPDLFTDARQQRDRMVDLYWPNDTHWSMQGQKYFGARLLHAVQQAIGAPAGGQTP